MMTPTQHKKERTLQRAPVWCRSNTLRRSSQNFSQLQSARERGKLCVPLFVRVLRLLQQQGINIPQSDQKSFPFRNLLEAYFMGSFPYGNPFGFCKAWRASYFLIHSMRWWQANIGQYRRLVITLQFSLRHFTKALAPLRESIPSRR